MANWIESLKRQILGEDRAITWEGATGAMRVLGAPSVERLLEETVRLSKGAVDRLTRNLIDRERLQPAANRIEVHLLVAGHDRAVKAQDAIDGMDLDRELSAALTDFAINQSQYLVFGGRIQVPPITVEERPESSPDEIHVRWRRDKDAPSPAGSPTAAPQRTSREERAAANRPADPAVLSSGRKTQHSGEGISQPFTLWVRDRDATPVAFPVMTPLYFGRNTRGLQIEFEFGDEELISGEHFSILYLQGLGFVLRDNFSTNGTLVVRGDEAVRLATPPNRREVGTAKEMRLKEGDVIRLERGTPSRRGSVQFGFALDGSGADGIQWADNLSAQRIEWRNARELVAQRVVAGDGPAPPEEYTLMIGESFLGSSITGSVWVAFREQDENFRDGRAVALVTNLSRCTLTWLRPDLDGRLNDTALKAGEATGVPGGSVLEFTPRASRVVGAAVTAAPAMDAPDPPATRVRFHWIEDHGRDTI